MDANALRQPLDLIVSSEDDAPDERMPVYPRDSKAGLHFLVPHGNKRGFEELVRAIESTPELEIFAGHMQYDGGGGASRVTYYHLADWLIDRSSETSSQQALAELSNYVSHDEFLMHQYLGLSGVTVSESLLLTDDLYLVPINDVPKSAAKNSFTNQYLSPGAIEMSSAIRREATAQRMHWSDESHLGTDFMRQMPAPRSFDDLYHAGLVIGLAVNAVPVPLAYWCAPGPSVPCGSASSFSSFDLVSSWRTPYTAIDQANIDGIRLMLEHYFALPRAVQARLNLSMSRLFTAQRRRNPVDRAVDLGIALEVLYFDEKNDKDEITFKLSVRAARFLNDDFEQRQVMRNRLTKLYGLRSTAAHTGSLPTKIKGLDGELSQPVALLNYGVECVRQTISKVISDGSIPIWTDFVLR